MSYSTLEYVLVIYFLAFFGHQVTRWPETNEHYWFSKRSQTPGEGKQIFCSLTLGHKNPFFVSAFVAPSVRNLASFFSEKEPKTKDLFV